MTRAAPRGRRLPGLRSLPIRLRLTLLYGALVFVVGCVLMAVAYTIVEHNLSVYSARVTAAQSKGRVPLLFPPPGRSSARAQLEEFLNRQRRIQGTIEHRARIDARDRVAVEFLLAVVALTLPSIALGYLLAGRALRPVVAITATAQRVAAGQLSERIGLSGPRDELRALADTFDAMLDKLEAAFDRQQAFIANASHELKTPLAIVRAELDATLSDPSSSAQELRAMAVAISAATSRSQRLIDHLLLLARNDAVGAGREPVQLDQIIEQVLEELALEPEARSIHLTVALQSTTVFGDEILLQSMVRNLIENAIRHNHDGGTVRITTTGSGVAATLEIENDGPLIAPSLVDRLFEPFRRLERTANPGRGAGLGLAIVRAVVAAQGGRLTARARPDGGLAIAVELPRPTRDGAAMAFTTRGALESRPTQRSE